MEHEEIQALRYPIGHYSPPETYTRQQIQDWIAELEALPARLVELVGNLSDPQLDTPYRPGGWTVRQVVHHLSDSHHNSYMRFKWALTEELPRIKVYDEKAWASLFDSRSGPVALSLNHLDAVHAKLVYLLKGLTPAQLKRAFIHPDMPEATSLEENIGRYAWHGNHHLAHVQNLIRREGW